VKAAEDNSGIKVGTGVTVDWQNGGGNIPDISYVVIYPDGTPTPEPSLTPTLTATPTITPTGTRHQRPRQRNGNTPDLNGRVESVYADSQWCAPHPRSLRG
jgi:hypothetical protein